MRAGAKPRSLLITVQSTKGMRRARQKAATSRRLVSKLAAACARRGSDAGIAPALDITSIKGPSADSLPNGPISLPTKGLSRHCTSE